MKIAIQRHPTRGKEVIQILKSLGGQNKYEFCAIGREPVYYYINKYGIIDISLKYDLYDYKLYTLEEFEKDFPFKIGDTVINNKGDEGFITGLITMNNKILYSVKYNYNQFGIVSPNLIKLKKKEMNTRNITLTLDKAKEWYNNGGELKEVALQAFTEQELSPLPKSWEEYCKRHKVSTVMFNPYIPNKYIALWKLEQLRDCYRQGWIPDWHNITETKYCIVIESNTFSISENSFISRFLSFQSEEVAEEFLKNFRPLIKQAGDLI